MIKIAHISDVHIRNLKFHREYREVFEKLYEELRKEKPDYIVNTGDTAHTKTQLSGDFFDLTQEFTKKLADIAPYLVLLGNHDGNCRNLTREDAISPIVKALNHPNIHLMKKSGEVCLDGKVSFNALSIFDEEGFKPISDPSKINIALYHGSVSGVVTDTGYVMEHGDISIDEFGPYDYVLLGDIHKTNQILDEKGACRYPGSLIQQNHGETNDKGFLIWEIEDKDNFDVRHISIPNPSPFITVELTPKGRIPKDTVIPPNARLRLVTNHDLPVVALKRALAMAKTMFKPESITFLNRANGRGSSEEELLKHTDEDLRDLKVQEKLIREFLKEYDVGEETLKRVVDLNKHYNGIVEGEEDVDRNVKWNLDNVEWDNLFNYSEENKINMDKVRGTVGIFGKNFSGKSSIIDSILWVMFNSTSKNVRKNIDIINQNKEQGSGRVTINIGEREYVIERTATKYTKKLKGQETDEAKTDVDFYYADKVTGEKVSLNGVSRNETDKNIRRKFGTLDDFLFTSMTAQNGSLLFVNEGSTKRKEVLAKFVDLDIFGKKHKLASDDAIDARANIRRLEAHDFDEEIALAKEAVDKNESATAQHKLKCGLLKEQVELLEEDVRGIDIQMASKPVFEVLDEDKAREELSELQQHKEKHEATVLESKSALVEKQELGKKIDSFIKDFDINEVKEKKEVIKSKTDELRTLLSDLKENENKEKSQHEKSKLLEEVPCGNKYSHCKFLLDANTAKDELPEISEYVQILSKNKEKLEEFIAELSPEQIDEHIEKHAKLLTRQNELRVEISSLKLKIERAKTQISTSKSQIETLEGQIEEFLKNKEDAKEVRLLKDMKKKHISELVELKEELEVCEEEMMELYKDHGSYEQKLESLQEKREELDELRSEYLAYELYDKCMHSNGISYDVIKRRLPVINEEIAKILANVVDFDIFFEDDGSKLDILIKHPKYAPRPLEACSGSERDIGAFAVRLALIKVSTLPVSDICILDEPGGAYDENSMEGFIRVVEMLKSQFKTIFLISHLDSLKDIVDQQIVIDKDDEGYAHVKV